MNIKEIIKRENLNCSEQEFQNEFDNIKIDTSELELLEPNIREFSEKYNGNIIDNPGNGKYYYELKIGGRVFLQNFVPFTEGFVGLDDNNIHDIIKKHKNNLINGYIFSSKIDSIIEKFKKG